MCVFCYFCSKWRLMLSAAECLRRSPGPGGSRVFRLSLHRTHTQLKSLFINLLFKSLLNAINSRFESQSLPSSELIGRIQQQRKNTQSIF